MAKIIFFRKGKKLAETWLKEMSDQTERDTVARETLDVMDYQTFDKFTITDNNGKNPRSAELTEYFQDAQGRIWKSLNDEK